MQAIRSLIARFVKPGQLPLTKPTSLTAQQLSQVAGGLPATGAWDGGQTKPPVA